MAAEFLISKGYTIVTRGFTVKGGEIDLIALDQDTLVFVEVKHRRGKLLPEEGIDQVKLSRMQVAAEQYLHRMDEAMRRLRYDVVAIDADGIRHHQSVL